MYYSTSKKIYKINSNIRKPIVVCLYKPTIFFNHKRLSTWRNKNSFLSNINMTKKYQKILRKHKIEKKTKIKINKAYNTKGSSLIIPNICFTYKMNSIIKEKFVFLRKNKKIYYSTSLAFISYHLTMIPCLTHKSFLKPSFHSSISHTVVSLMYLSTRWCS